MKTIAARGDNTLRRYWKNKFMILTLIKSDNIWLKHCILFWVTMTGPWSPFHSMWREHQEHIRVLPTRLQWLLCVCVCGVRHGDATSLIMSCLKLRPLSNIKITTKGQLYINVTPSLFALKILSTRNASFTLEGHSTYAKWDMWINHRMGLSPLWLGLTGNK